MQTKTIGDILIINQDDLITEFINLKNDAAFCLLWNGVQYYDPYGNAMISYPTALAMDSKVYSLKKMRDEVKRQDGNTIILLPIEQIQEIANKTFYTEGQFRAIDFLTFTITEEK